MQRMFDLINERTLRVRREGSPTYIHTYGIIAAAGGREHIEIAATFPDAKKYEPLNRVFLVNTSSELLNIEINGRAFNVLPANSTQGISNEAIWTFALINNHATDATAAGEVIATFDRAPVDQDQIARESA